MNYPNVYILYVLKIFLFMLTVMYFQSYLNIIHKYASDDRKSSLSFKKREYFLKLRFTDKFFE